MDAALFQYTPEFRKSQLEGILTDCVLVYSKISSSNKELENNENKIRDAIEEYLADDNYSAIQLILTLQPKSILLKCMKSYPMVAISLSQSTYWKVQSPSFICGWTLHHALRNLKSNNYAELYSK